MCGMCMCVRLIVADHRVHVLCPCTHALSSYPIINQLAIDHLHRIDPLGGEKLTRMTHGYVRTIIQCAKKHFNIAN